MAPKDLGCKALGSINDVFADIFNVLLFQGREVIKGEEVEDAEPRSQYHVKSGYHEQIRDVAKYWKKKKVRLAFFGIENESAATKYMPLRMISYDGGVYRSQLPLRTKKKGKKERKLQNTLYPVVSLVLHFGTKHKWNQPKNLHGVLEIAADLKPYVNDYCINVIDVAFLEREQIDSFKSDFWFVADYFWQIRTNKKYKPSEKEMHHAYAVLQMMSAMTGDSRFEKAYNKVKKEGRKETMCEYLDEIVAEGEARGKAQGEMIGEARGVEAGISILISTLSEMGVSDGIIAEKIQEKYKLGKDEAGEKVRKYRIKTA